MTNHFISLGYYPTSCWHYSYYRVKVSNLSSKIEGDIKSTLTLNTHIWGYTSCQLLGDYRSHLPLTTQQYLRLSSDIQYYRPRYKKIYLEGLNPYPRSLVVSGRQSQLCTAFNPSYTLYIYLLLPVGVHSVLLAGFALLAKRGNHIVNAHK